MSDIYEYLKWRGDLSMKLEPFNEIDSLILSELVYVDFKTCAPSFLSGQALSLADVAHDFFINNDEKELLDRFSFIKESINLLKVLAKTARFKNIKLSNYLSELDYQNVKQFAALTFKLEDGTIYIAYRGTDDTILGWKEDFQMTYLYPVQSQIRAGEYLEKIARINFSNSWVETVINRPLNSSLSKAIYQYCKHKLFGVPIILGGHSKGGNLAVYGASVVSKKIQKRIQTIYNFDGPGFTAEMIKQTNYHLIANKIKKYIPENSVFGIMLKSLETPVIVKSNAKGLMQHSGFTWQVSSKKFVTVENLSEESLAMNEAFKAWLSKIDLDTRKNAVTAAFSILEALDLNTIDDLSEKSFVHLINGLKEFTSLKGEARTAIIQFIKTLIIESNNYQKYYRKNNHHDENSQ